jgi:hypothetical protein
MAGLLPNEGEHLVANLLFKNADADRGTNLDLVLFTNTTVSETSTAAALTQPTVANGYVVKTLTDASWTVTADTATYTSQTWTATGSFSAPVYGYAILSKGTTPRIIAIELDVAGPFTIVNGDTYTVTPSIVVA